LSSELRQRALTRFRSGLPVSRRFAASVQISASNSLVDGHEPVPFLPRAHPESKRV
jgi:hypothetical protein